MADTILKVDNINVYYGNIHAVKGVSFTVNEGEIVTLIGANGAGKSTTLKTVSGLLKPRSGDVLYKGKSIKGVRAHKIVEAGLAQVPGLTMEGVLGMVLFYAAGFAFEAAKLPRLFQKNA